MTHDPPRDARRRADHRPPHPRPGRVRAACRTRSCFDEADLREHLFGTRRYAEVLLAEDAGRWSGFALFFHNYSTFLGKPGIYLEDLFVDPGAPRARGTARRCSWRWRSWRWSAIAAASSGRC